MKSVLYIAVLLLQTQRMLSSPSEKIFIVDESMRCKPATKYFQKIETGDSLSYTLRIKNDEHTLQQIVLEIPIQQIDRICLKQTDEQNALIKNYVFVSKKLSQRIYYDRNIVFPFDIKADETNTITLRFHKKDIHNYFRLEVLIWKKDAKMTRTQALELTRGVFYGILILYTFICLLLTILLNASNYYYYLLYLMAGTVYLFIKNNLGYELLWPDHPALDIFLKKMMLSTYMIASILFLRGFIKRRIYLPFLQNTLRYFIYFGLLLVVVSLSVGLLSSSAQNTFIIIQNIFALVCLSTVVLTFLFMYFNINERSLVLFTLLYFISFSFFLFYPQPEFGNDVFGVYLGQIYTYSNAFIIATIICVFTVYRVLQIIKNNERLKKEVSVMNSQNNFSLIEGQQNERTRVGRELHDGIGIMMSAVKMKMSAIKTNDKQEEKQLKKIIKEVDEICTEIRQYSHTLLPPTLKKFGLQVALKDMFEDYRQQQVESIQYNFNIPDNLSPVSLQLVYDILKNIIQYFSKNKPEQLTISIYIIASIREAQIRIQHTGATIDVNDEYIQSVLSVVNLLNGKFQQSMINAWNYRLHMEFPILIDEPENGKKFNSISG